MQNMKYSLDIQSRTFENSLKISADKLFVVTYKNLVSTARQTTTDKGFGRCQCWSADNLLKNFIEAA